VSIALRKLVWDQYWCPDFLGLQFFGLTVCFAFDCSTLWRTESSLQQTLNAAREELQKKEQGLRSLTGKVSNDIMAAIVAYEVQNNSF
jgi:hypothetical protein